MKKTFKFRTIKDEYNCTNTILDFVLLLYFVEPLFFYRLKQHNGKLKGGAKASRAGRPWTCACIVQGFKDQSEACMFESKWKSFSRKLPRKKEVEGTGIGADDGAGSLHLLKHREAALNRVKGCVDCSHLDIEWHQDPS
ncbi:structure-specific endonuclease subunit SLX1 [Cinnamomum micranthum f. kanehirae]|uniref:Structure-specific endonuclease subunit SLX1 n=1 Tax=Cinnamomum micranthum f. kanehirae TaxID=337451 RepID=A0A3S3NBR6_9MAGN|nr:structure-specific endonuclease subunit SLX1 [Cinnamomum micranthum f. kanehirae]